MGQTLGRGKKKLGALAFKSLTIVLIALLGIFVWVNPTKADVSQATHNYTTPYYVSNLIQTLGKFSTGTITDVKVWHESTNYFALVENPYEYFAESSTCAITNDVINLGIEHVIDLHACGEAYCSSTSIYSDGSKFWYLFWYQDSYAKGSALDSFKGEIGDFGASNCSDYGDLKDTAFEITGIESSYGSENSIGIIKPVNGITTTNDSDYLFWGVNVFAPKQNCSATTPCRIDIKSWLNSSSALLIDSTYIYSTTTESHFPKNYNLANGLWHAQAFLYSSYDYPLTTVASSTQITFTITGSTVPGGTMATTTLENVEISCNYGNWFSDGICSVLAYLFQPSGEILSKISNIINNLINKPPLGYFNLIKDTISQIEVGSSTNTIISASTTEAFAPIFNPIKIGFSWILWFSFSFHLFNRFRHLQI